MPAPPDRCEPLPPPSASGGRVLTHRVEGRGEAMLLLNGGMMSIPSWEPVASRLAAHFRVIRFDFRGQLLSPGEPPADLAGHAADAVALLDHLRVGAAHLVGTSFGAQVALELAARYPDRARTLVAAPAVDRCPLSMTAIGERLRDACRAAAAGDPAPFFAALTEIVYSPAFRAAQAEALERNAKALASVPAAWFAAVERLLMAIERMDLRPLLPAIASPTLVLAGELDALMPPASTEAMAGAIPQARFDLLAGVGHAFVVEAAEEFAQRVLRFATMDKDKAVGPLGGRG